MIFNVLRRFLVFLMGPCLFFSKVMAQGEDIATLTTDLESGKLVFSLKAPIALSLSSDYQGGSIGFVLQNVYSDVKGPAVEVFTGAASGVDVNNTLRVYIPSQNFVGSTSYGTWGTRSNAGGIINSRDFFGSIALDGSSDLNAGDQIIILPGQVMIGTSAATLLPESLSNSTRFQFFNPLTSSALSVSAGIGASSVPLPKTSVNAPVVTQGGVEVSWTGPGLLEASPDLGDTVPWFFSQNPNNASKPPLFIPFRDLQKDGQTQCFFRMAMPWETYFPDES